MYVYECNICNICKSNYNKARCLNKLYMKHLRFSLLLLIYWDRVFLAFCNAFRTEQLWCHDPKSPRYARPLATLPSADHLFVTPEFRGGNPLRFCCISGAWNMLEAYGSKDVAALNARKGYNLGAKKVSS